MACELLYLMGGDYMITVNLYYKGINGNARAFADEMESSGP